MMMSVEEKKRRRRYQREELIEAVDRLQNLSHRHDAIAAKIAETRARRDLYPAERGVMLTQMTAAYSAITNDVVTLQARVKTLGRELDL